MREILRFIEAQLAEDQAAGEHLLDWTKHPNPSKPADTFAACMTDPIIGPFNGRTPHTNIQTGMNVVHVADPARILAAVVSMRRIVELHTTGVYRTYQCSNADHIQEWQCERANEPYTEHRYCEVCGNECVEVPLLAEIWAGRPGFKPEWRLP